MKPHISYVICAVRRSGSFLLFEALTNTGLAGNPQEYFINNGEGWEVGWCGGGDDFKKTVSTHIFLTQDLNIVK